ncbi:DinB family protein [Neolewinella persica]|uniref:DinB family protein n=1 Tax=Neolewinella persica TaxID=70998 RepID=UPI000374912D|nr:DinB family protein [Neolewinella persica]
MNLASETLDRILRAAAQMLAPFDDDAMSRQPAPGKWSPKQILGHLIDSAYNNHGRFLIAADQDHLRFPGYDQNAWVERNGYQEQDAREVVSTFFVVQSHLGQLLNNLPDELLNRQTTDHTFATMAMRPFPDGAPSCLGYFIEDYLFHLVHHLKQIDPDFKEDWYIGYQR